ncbi:MAG: hypothetical protein EA422_03460 [Gemmatimonadales bacterium]|nr:MAG: hypothetical protein EA422_03460 [Gemmatimonadales bacterium]
MGAKFLRPRVGTRVRRERLTTPDDDFLDLDFVAGLPGQDDQPLVIILHGLEGSTRRGYVRLAMAELALRGIPSVGLNFRSCSGELNRRPRFYHSGETSDLAFVVRTLAERWPGRPLGALGFSLGGNVLLKYLGESGRMEEGPLAVAAAVSVPFDLLAGTRALETAPMGRVYSHYFLRSLRRKTAGKADLIRKWVDLDGVRRARTLREYDEAATAPLHGFPGAEIYYRRSSSAGFLQDIRTPTLLLQSDDDPFLPREALPRAVVEANPRLLAAFTSGGGHVGFVDGPGPWSAGFWAEREAARYLHHMLSRLY